MPKTKEELASELGCKRGDVAKCRTYKKGKLKGQTKCFCAKIPFPTNFMRVRIFEPDPDLWYPFRKGRTRSYTTEKGKGRRSSNYYITSRGQEFTSEDQTTISLLPESQSFLTLDIGGKGGIMFIRGVPTSLVSNDVYQQVVRIEKEIIELKRKGGDKKMILDLQSRLDEIAFVKWENTRTQAIRAEYGKGTGRGIGASAKLVQEYESVWVEMEDIKEDPLKRERYAELERRLGEIQDILIGKFMKKYGEIAKKFLSREWDTPITFFQILKKGRDFQLHMECAKGCMI